MYFIPLNIFLNWKYNLLHVIFIGLFCKYLLWDILIKL